MLSDRGCLAQDPRLMFPTRALRRSPSLLLRRVALPGAALAAVLAATVVAYAPALDGDFTYDDERSIVLNPRVHRIAGVIDGLDLPASLAQRPVTDLTFAFDAEISGLSARAFHETSLVLHLATVLAVFALTRGLFRRAGHTAAVTWSAVAVTALFALHPLQTEAVAYVVQRSEVLASLLAIAALGLLFAAERQRSTARTVTLGLAALAAYALAAGAKLIATAVPFLFLLGIFCFPERDGLPASAARSRWVRRATLVLPLVTFSAVQLTAFFESARGSPKAGFSVPGLTPWQYFLTQGRVIPMYLRLLVWPVGQNIDHDVRASSGLMAPPTTIAGGLLVLAVISGAIGAIVWARRKANVFPAVPAMRIAGFGAAWFLVMLAPTSTIVPLADVAVEHRSYLASWGIIAAAVALAPVAARSLPEMFRRAALVIMAVSVACMLTYTLHARATLWGDPVALWLDASAKSPAKARPHLNIAYELQQRGNVEGAVSSYRRALALGVEGDLQPHLLQNIASALLAAKRPREARDILAPLAANPDPETVVLLAFVAIDVGDLAAADRYVWELVNRAYTYDRSFEAQARLMMAKGNVTGARDSYRKATALSARADTLVELGKLELQLGEIAAACRSLGRAAKAPGDRWASRWAAAEAGHAGCGRVSP